MHANFGKATTIYRLEYCLLQMQAVLQSSVINCNCQLAINLTVNGNQKKKVLRPIFRPQAIEFILASITTQHCQSLSFSKVIVLITDCNYLSQITVCKALLSSALLRFNRIAKNDDCSLFIDSIMHKFIDSWTECDCLSHNRISARNWQGAFSNRGCVAFVAVWHHQVAASSLKGSEMASRCCIFL